MTSLIGCTSESDTLYAFVHIIFLHISFMHCYYYLFSCTERNAGSPITASHGSHRIIAHWERLCMFTKVQRLRVMERTHWSLFMKPGSHRRQMTCMH